MTMATIFAKSMSTRWQVSTPKGRGFFAQVSPAENPLLQLLLPFIGRRCLYWSNLSQTSLRSGKISPKSSRAMIPKDLG